MRLGINLSAPIGEKFTSFMQMTAQQAKTISGYPVTDYLKLDQLGIRYEPTSELTVTAGRQVLPLWMLSEEMDLGVSYPWVRPQYEVYNSSPVSRIDGIRGVYTINAGDFTIRPSILVGNNSEQTATNGIPITTFLRAQYANLEVEYGVHFLRGVYGRGKGKLDVMGGNTAIDYTFYAGGYRSQWNNILTMAEYAVTKVDFGKSTSNIKGLLSEDGGQDRSAYYLTAGYRLFDVLTPHVTYSAAKYMARIKKDTVYTTLAANLKAVGVKKEIYKERNEYAQNTVTVGANYQLTDKAVLKAEWAQTIVPDGEDINQSTSNLPRGAKAQTFGTTIDFVM